MPEEVRLTLPPLDPEPRSREYDSYELPTRARVVRAWLFDGASTRAIDEEILGYDSSWSRGWQAMGILHHLGLKTPHKGLFEGRTAEEVIALMQAEAPRFSRVVEHLRAPTEERTVALATLQRQEAQELSESRRDSSDARQRRLATASARPERVRVFTYAYKRNPDIVAEALLRAAGHCERCRREAPFKRASDGTPYLEVHHRESLSAGGADSLANVLALCPNCHRDIHHGQSGSAEA